MKKSYNFLINPNSSLKRISFLFVLSVALICQSLCAQSQEVPGLNSIQNTFIDSEQTKAINAEGDFIIKDGILDEVKSFSLKMSLASKNIFVAEDTVLDSLDFKLTHVMVLPNMKMIHVVGLLNISGVSKRTEFDFNYIINEDQSLSLFAKKSIKVSDFNHDAKMRTSALKSKNTANLNLDLQLLFKRENNNYFASN